MPLTSDGIEVSVETSLPSASTKYRNKIVCVNGVGANPDRFYLCLWNGTAYEWIELGVGGVNTSETGRSTTVSVAASDASNKSREQADYTCDGVADEVQIQAALDDLTVGGKVLLSEGTFKTDNPIVIDDNEMIEGMGDGTIIQPQANMTGVIINANRTGANYFMRLNCFAIDGNGKTCDGVNWVTDSATPTSHSKITELHIYNCDGNGIYTQFCREIHIKNNQIGDFFKTANTGDGIKLEGQYDMMVESNQMIQNGGHGINLYKGVAASAHTGIVNDNYCAHNGGNGIYTFDHDSLTLGDNVCEQNTGDGIYVNGGNSSVVGNKVGGNSGHGIVVDDHNLCTITGNVIQNHVGVGKWNLSLQAGFVTVDGNDIENGYGGVLFLNTIGMVVSGNRIRGTTNNETIRISGTTGDENLIEGNVISNSATYGIEVRANNDGNTIINNKFSGNASGNLNDLAENTRVNTLVIPVPNPDGNIGDVPAKVLTDGADTTHRVLLPIPDDFHEVVTAAAVVVPGGTGNFRRSVTTDFGVRGASEDYNEHSDNIAVGVVAVTQNENENIDISDALTGVGARDNVGIAFTREGVDAADTVGADCYFTAIELRYV
jgi:parallel beta-helix repeat protein